MRQFDNRPMLKLPKYTICSRGNSIRYNIQATSTGSYNVLGNKYKHNILYSRLEGKVSRVGLSPQNFKVLEISLKYYIFTK